MSTTIKTSRLAATVFVAAALAVGGSALTSSASAESKDPVPTGKAGCTYAGSDYSHGSTRQQVKNYSNGTKAYENYECRNGEWVYTGMSRTVPQAGINMTKSAGTVTPPQR